MIVGWGIFCKKYFVNTVGVFFSPSAIKQNDMAWARSGVKLRTIHVCFSSDRELLALLRI